MQVPVYDKDGNLFANVDTSTRNTAECAALTYNGRIFTFQGGHKIEMFRFVEQVTR